MEACSRSWSIHTNPAITQRYQILHGIGSGAYSDVYKAKRLFDGLIVALKEIHDQQSAIRELQALQTLNGAPNIVQLIEYFWSDHDDPVLVLEFLPMDLNGLIAEAKKEWNGGIRVSEMKRWMIQVLKGVEACHGCSIMHRDLKPSNLLVSADGEVKLADFGQAIILQEPPYASEEVNVPDQDQPWIPKDPDPNPEDANLSLNQSNLQQEPMTAREEDIPTNQDHLKKDMNGNDKCPKMLNGSTDSPTSCNLSYPADDFSWNPYSEDDEEREDDESGLTSCVGTRWYRAPELLYGSRSYSQEIDLWSLGCIFAELFSLEPLFAGNSDIDQLNRISRVLGNLNQEAWPGCLSLPDYGKIFFSENPNPLGLKSCLPNCSSSEIQLLERLICYDPSKRAPTMELLKDKYFAEEPLPVPVNELRLPSTVNGQENSSMYNYDWKDYDSDFEGFGGAEVSTSDSGFCIRFS
ncbi:cyclin-dependent kinase F-1 [Amborella trichopoda]|uniref:cyclin-dependent kinase n=1 Tax=Amborella trichopoda TaxID=13333 RepID=W1NVC8_AMBTC|nr:cyclin-dependent kinase F-1 [Amborella trichopoda]ERM98629.1 hypothetical protein AMTR_s00109p00093510 [Amborella trichopoda]|eukprot:XP_006833351.1 cyclin-dependent kinase F-1 [Amborella trichopoda]